MRKAIPCLAVVLQLAGCAADPYANVSKEDLDRARQKIGPAAGTTKPALSGQGNLPLPGREPITRPLVLPPPER